MSILAINIGLGEHGEFHTVGLFDMSLNLLIITRLLISELIAGENQNFQSLVSVLSMKLN